MIRWSYWFENSIPVNPVRSKTFTLMLLRNGTFPSLTVHREPIVGRNFVLYRTRINSYTEAKRLESPTTEAICFPTVAGKSRKSGLSSSPYPSRRSIQA